MMVYNGIMEKKMETTIMGYIGVILGLYWDNGKENGNYKIQLLNWPRAEETRGVCSTSQVGGSRGRHRASSP